MFNDLDPREKKALIIFFALLALIVTYLGTHNIEFENTESLLEEQDSLQQFPPPTDQPRSYESYL